MKTKLWSFGVSLVFAATCLAQNVPPKLGDIPVRLRLLENVPNDQTARRFMQALGSQIQGSGKFYLSLSSELSPNAIRITLRSIQITSTSGEGSGSAIFVEADHPTDKDPTHYTSVFSNGFSEISEKMWMVSKDDAAIDGEAAAFLSDLDSSLRY